MHDVATASIEDGDQVEERAANIQVRDVDVPMLVRLDRLLESRALSADLVVPPLDEPSALQNPINRRRTGATMPASIIM